GAWGRVAQNLVDPIGVGNNSKCRCSALIFGHDEIDHATGEICLNWILRGRRQRYRGVSFIDFSDSGSTCVADKKWEGRRRGDYEHYDLTASPRSRFHQILSGATG